MKIYVYGTLRKGSGSPMTAGLNYVLTGVRAPGRIRSLGGFPGLEMTSETSVVYDVVEVTDPAQLDRLDHYEGYRADDLRSSLYLRVPFMDGETYVYNHPFNPRIHEVVPDGDWIAYTSMVSKGALHVERC